MKPAVISELRFQSALVLVRKMSRVLNRIPLSPRDRFEALCDHIGTISSVHGFDTGQLDWLRLKAAQLTGI